MASDVEKNKIRLVQDPRYNIRKWVNRTFAEMTEVDALSVQILKVKSFLDLIRFGIQTAIWLILKVIRWFIMKEQLEYAQQEYEIERSDELRDSIKDNMDGKKKP